MNLEKVDNEEKLKLCRKYFIGGFLALPFLWFVNVVWFYKYAFINSPFPQQPEIKKYVIRSGVGASIWIMALVAWNVVFQINRAGWGAMGDMISFNIPSGMA